MFSMAPKILFNAALSNITNAGMIFDGIIVNYLNNYLITSFQY